MIIKKVLPILLGILMLLSIGASAAATTNSTSYNTNQISQAASVVKHNVDTKYSLPTSVTVGSSKVTNSQFLYLLTTATKNLATNNKSPIKLRTVSNPTSTSETITRGTLTKTQYLTIANQINTYITANSKVPSYVTTPLGKMKYQSLIYMYSKILTYNQVTKTLPGTVSVKSWYAQTLGPAAVINSSAILKAKPVVLGQNKYGKVLKLGPFGTGVNKVAIIVGVHPQEVQTHIAMLNAIGALYKNMKNVQIWIYDVVVYNGADYSTGRAEGQYLANKYVVPNIGTSYKLVVDIHGNTGNGAEKYSGYPNFIFSPLKDSKSLIFASKIAKSKYTGGDLLNHYVSGTSPAYVTIPIAKKGIPTLVYEQYINQANYAQLLYQHALQVVNAINSVFAKT
jgi:hypothetical protein